MSYIKETGDKILDRVESVCDEADDDVSDDDVYPEEAEPGTRLKTGIDLNELIHDKAVTFELADAPNNQSEREQCNNMYFGQEEVIKYLNPCSGFEDDEDEEVNDEDDMKTPYDELAKKMEALTDDRGVLKRIVKSGHGTGVPDGALITAHYNAYLEHIDEPFDSTRLRGRPFKASVGDYSMLPGLEIGLKSMKKGEIAQFLIQPYYAYGKMGCPPRIPENAVILYEVELLDILDYAAATIYNKLSEDERQEAKFDLVLGAGKAEHNSGNDFFQKKLFGKAVARYTRAIDMLEKCNLKDEEEDKTMQKLLLKLYLNMALCRLKLKLPVKAMTACNQALSLDKDNVKALYRKGEAKAMLSEYSEARRFYLRAKRLDPKNTAITTALKNLDEKEAKYRSLEKLMCVRMLNMSLTKRSVSEQDGADAKVDSEVSEEFRKVLEERLENFCKDSDTVEMPFGSLLTAPEMAYLTSIAKRMNLTVKIVKAGEKEDIKIVKNVALED